MTGKEIFETRLNDNTRRSALKQYECENSIFEIIEKCVNTITIVDGMSEEEAIELFVSFVLEKDEMSCIEGIIL